MSDWLSYLHKFYTRQQPFVVATVTSYHGSSPDLPGACIFYSEQETACLVSSDTRQEMMLTTSKLLLANQTPFHLEQLPLGDVATKDNGYCDVLYEYFSAAIYPHWLQQLRENYQQRVASFITRDFTRELAAKSVGSTPEHSAGAGNRCIKTIVATNIDNLPAANAIKSAELQSAGDRTGSSNCRLIKNPNGLILFRALTNQNIPLVIAGSHSVATEITALARSLPIDVQHISTDNIVGALHGISAGAYVVIMTGDHTLDFTCCKSLLGRDDITFVGCIGSAGKAASFNERLVNEGVSPKDLSKLCMPIGLKQIKGKQTSIVAVSVVSQILSLHQW